MWVEEVGVFGFCFRDGGKLLNFRLLSNVIGFLFRRVYCGVEIGLGVRVE